MVGIREASESGSTTDIGAFSMDRYSPDGMSAIGSSGHSRASGIHTGPNKPGRLLNDRCWNKIRIELTLICAL
jgi:hypothetical protein